MIALNENARPKKDAFLAAYAELGNVTAAAKAAGCSRESHYLWMKEDKDYPDRFSAAHAEACDALESEARRRAVKGTRKPVFHKGVRCGTVREYSDTLLIFLMKGAMPEKYRERLEHSGPGGGAIPHEHTHQAIDKQRAELAAIGARLGIGVIPSSDADSEEDGGVEPNIEKN